MIFQLYDAENDLKNARDAYLARSLFVEQQTQEYRSVQVNVDRRLLIVTQSETSDDAVRRFETTMGKLRALDIAKRYTEMLLEVDQLR